MDGEAVRFGFRERVGRDMEIRIKTEAEFRESYVTLEIKADQDEAVEVSRRLFGPVEGQAKVRELESELQALRNNIDELTAGRDRMRARIDHLDMWHKRDLDLQMKQTREARDEAMRKLAEALSQKADAMKDRDETFIRTMQVFSERNELLRKLGRITDLVWLDPNVTKALFNTELSVHTRWSGLADAIHAVREIIGEPEA